MGEWIKFYSEEELFSFGGGADPFEAQDPIFSEPLVSAGPFKNYSEEELFPYGRVEIDTEPVEEGLTFNLDGITTPGTVSPTTTLHIQAGPIQKVIKFKRLYLEAKVPTRKFPEDAGLDVYSLDTVYIAARSQEVMRTGIALAGAPDDAVIQVWPKSGLDARLGLHIGAGIIDPNYRGEILVLLKNMSDHSVGINKGDAIAQLVIVLCMRPEIEIVSEIENTDRGDQGGINDNSNRG